MRIKSPRLCLGVFIAAKYVKSQNHPPFYTIKTIVNMTLYTDRFKQLIIYFLLQIFRKLLYIPLMEYAQYAHVAKFSYFETFFSVCSLYLVFSSYQLKLSIFVKQCHSVFSGCFSADRSSIPHHPPAHDPHYFYIPRNLHLLIFTSLLLGIFSSSSSFQLTLVAVDFTSVSK